jgi:hypothetical protein
MTTCNSRRNHSSFIRGVCAPTFIQTKSAANAIEFDALLC